MVRALALALGIGFALVCPAAPPVAPGEPSAQPAPDAARIELRYQGERAACALLPAGEERDTCLREAAAARAEALRGRLDSGAADYDANAVARCEALQGDLRRDCISRMRGAGSVSGSVEGGGLLREYRTRELGPDPGR